MGRLTADPTSIVPDQVVAQTDLVTVGAFRCPTSHPQFRDSGPIRQACFVFPRTAVVIAHEGRPPFLADPTIVTLYNTGQQYTREPVSADGDRCDWFAVDQSVLREAARTFDPVAAEDPTSPLRFARASSGPALYLKQRQIFESARLTPSIDPLWIDEAVVTLLRDVLAIAYDDAPRARPTAERIERRRADLVDAARRLMLRRFAEPITLSGLAGRLACSPFHLCRTFHSATGSTLHAYLTQIRLRSALERIAEGMDLTRIALEVGYSSHSHFTVAFRRAFGLAPSAASAARKLRARSR